jgi:thymidylate synthase ThyX
VSYEVTILADSVSPAGARLTTFQLKYPRMVHAELLMHRTFSRSASSTRAIPVAKMVEWVMTDPAIPVYWGKNQRGMQAGEELSAVDRFAAECAWLSARDRAVEKAQQLMDFGLHKQLASRLLEPWAHINVVLTSTSFANFFALRCHRDAMPEIQVLAVRMARAYRASRPISLELGGWHLPYVAPGEFIEWWLRDEVDLAIKCSVARCARVSYKTFEGKDPDPEADIALHGRLLESGHWGPFEHQATPIADPSARSGNFRGWHQYRQALHVSVHDHFDFARLDEYGDRDFIV